MLAYAWAFWPVLAEMNSRWWGDPQYSFAYVVPGFTAWWLWSRRERMPEWLPWPNWWGLVLVGFGLLTQLTGAVYFVQWLEGASLVPVIAGLIWFYGGWPLLSWAWPAVLYLIFLVPLPYSVQTALSGPLQVMATRFSTYALQTLGFPAVSEGTIVLINEVRIGVVEACNGLGMILAFVALTTAVIMVIRRQWPDKLVIWMSAIPIAMAANVARIIVTAAAATWFGEAAAKVVFHDLAGWLMMPLALALVAFELWYLDRLLPPAYEVVPLSVTAAHAPVRPKVETAPVASPVTP